MKLLQFLAGLLPLLSAFTLYATAYNTINIDGTNDFVSDESFSGTSGSQWFFTWDDSFLYIGLDATDVGSNNGNIFMTLYIDTDPTEPLNGGDGSTSGVTYNTQNPNLPFAADYHLRWKADGTYTNILDYNNFTASWTDDNTGNNNFGLTWARSGTYVEFAIPLAQIGNPHGIHVSAAMINEAGGGEFTFFMFPDSNVQGYDANFTDFWALNLDDGVSPNMSSFLNLNLPVVLGDFKATQEEESVMLSWKTYSEINFGHFEIQRSHGDRSDWENIATIEGKGNATKGFRYKFIDEDTPSGSLLYRLKMIDLDHSFEYSDVAKVMVRQSQDIRFNTLVRDRIVFSRVENSDLEVEVYTLAGHRIMSRTISSDSDLDVSDLNSGVYILHASQGSVLQIVQQFIKE